MPLSRDSTLLLFDNGNLRRRAIRARTARTGLELDEEAMTASLVVNLDLDLLSRAGGGERMPNGNYVFDAGSREACLRPVDRDAPDGTKVYVQEVPILITGPSA